MSGLLCCLRARRNDMGAALSQHEEGDACDGTSEVPAAPPTMADVIRERKKKAGGAVGTLRRRIVNAARRPRDSRPDRGCEHARYIRSVVCGWRLAEVWVLGEELEALAALRDLTTRAELARPPAPALHQALPALLQHSWWCDVQVCGAGWSIGAHRAVLAARSTYFRDLLHRLPPGSTRVVLDGAQAQIPREAARAALLAMYGARDACLCDKYETNENGELDIDTNDDNSGCVCGRWSRCEVRRVCAALGAAPDPLHTSIRYLLDSGELCDCRLVFGGGEGAQAHYGFRAALELPAHRAILAARSRVLRSVLARSGSSGCVCVDEAVLPRRFARALLHAAYTDQVDLSLIGRNSSSPASTNSGNSGTVSGRGSRGASACVLDDAFQLYEIARFLEMPIVVQGCEDAIVEALSPDTLPHVLRWAAQPHASQWVHRQAMRYLRDEFTVVMSSASAPSVPSWALSSALGSSFTQTSEAGALRAALRWAGDQRPAPRPAPRPRPRRAPRPPDAHLRDNLAPLLPLLRLEHLPPDHDLLQQLIRRGVISVEAIVGHGAEDSVADKWLGRGAYRGARCFMPYLDEIKALLEDQAVPEAELARARRARYVNKIPDTLYMVSGARCGPSGGGVGGVGGECGGVVCARTLGALRARVAELRAAPAAALAGKHTHHATEVHRQLSLRAVRERSLPDSCADLLMQDPIPEESTVEYERSTTPERGERCADRCCQHGFSHNRWPSTGERCVRGTDTRYLSRITFKSTLHGSGSLRCASTGSLRSAPALHIPIDNNSRPGTCRREQSNRNDGSHHSWSVGVECGRLSAAVPDVAMAPNANTHLLTHRDYFRHPPPWEYGGVVLQLDLGDGATHTPRPGSRAQRNSGATNTRPRDYAQAMSCVRPRTEEEEAPRAQYCQPQHPTHPTHPAHTSHPTHPTHPSHPTLNTPHRNNTLPHYRDSTGGHASRLREPPAPTHPPRGSACPSPSPRHRHYPHEYRLEPTYGGSASTSRAHSPNNYA